MSLLKELVNLKKQQTVTEADTPWDMGYLDGYKGRTPVDDDGKAKRLFPESAKDQRSYLDGVLHGYHDWKGKHEVNEMDFAFGGAKAQPATTDGPPPPENGAETPPYDDYADYEIDDAEAGMGDDSHLEGEDTVELDVPLFIRMLEWAREEAQSDEEIHSVVTNIVSMDKCLTMDDYEEIMAEVGGEETPAQNGSDDFDQVDFDADAEGGEGGGDVDLSNNVPAGGGASEGKLFRMG